MQVIAEKPVTDTLRAEFNYVIPTGKPAIRYIDWPEGDIEITWGWPVTIENQWREVALVRSAFGRPSTVNDGQTVLLAPHSSFVQPRVSRERATVSNSPTGST